jgi:hypothetical protein
MTAMSVLNVSTLPNWVQACGAIALVILTGWTLAVLRRYAADTATIAKLSAAQTENSQMPFLAVTWKVNVQQQQAAWAIHNQGFGPALNVIVIVRSNEGDERITSMSPLATSQDRFLPDNVSAAFNHGSTIGIRYSSLSGMEYHTTVTLANGMTNTQFVKPKA